MRKEKGGMRSAVLLTGLASTTLAAAFIAAQSIFGGAAFLALAITFSTVSYHFLMRLAVGLAFDRVMKNRADPHAAWFRERRFEKRLYALLRVKRWKGRMPSYEPSLFDPAQHTWSEIVGATCQAELVHETIAALSLLPIAASAFFGELAVFLLTSLFGAALDLAFAVMQRYNRPRLVRLAERREDAGRGT